MIIMENNIYKQALQHTSCAFAYHEAVFDENDKMIDYVFLDINKSFEELTGLRREDIIGKRYLRDVAQGAENANKWVDIYSKIISEGKTVEFEEGSNERDRFYSIRAFRVEENRFITVFTDKTFQNKMQKIGQYFINNMGSEIDFHGITEFARDVSGAEYAVFNLLSENEKDFTTVGVAGLSKMVEKGARLLGFDLIGKKWPYDPLKDELTKENVITFFDGLHDLSKNTISESVISRLEKTFNLGIVIVAKIIKEEKVLGDFTLIFKRGKSLKNKDLLMLYLPQLGLFVEKNKLDVALKVNQRMFYTLAEFAPFGFLSCNIKGEIAYANERLVEIMGLPSIEAGKKINLMKYPRLIESGFSKKLLECVEENRIIDYEMSYTSPWGKNSWFRVHFTPYKDDRSVIGANIIIEDITDKKKNEEELLEKANRDPLTGAYNRNVLESILVERLDVSKQNNLISCVATVDIDDFKNINDTYGHGVGDSVLIHVADRIKQELREEDLFVRTGGDEFLVYLHNIKNKEEALVYAKKIFEALSAPYYFGDSVNKKDVNLGLSCSIGFSIFPNDGKTVEELMLMADKAMYNVKKSGKGTYAFA